MSKSIYYYIVEASALPEIFHKVVEAKRLLDIGEAKTVNQAVKLMGISRSAYYKYKDVVRPFQDMLHGRIITFQMIIKDEPGILSAVLNSIADCGGNVLTINQGIPLSGSAVVSISLETSNMQVSIHELLEGISLQKGVLKSEFLAG